MLQMRVQSSADYHQSLLMAHLMRAVPLLSNLDALLLDCHSSAEMRNHPLRECVLLREAALLMHILAHAARLRVLQLTCDFTLPVMPLTLQHIMMSVTCRQAEDLHYVLGAVPNLQSLLLSGRSVCGQSLKGSIQLNLAKHRSLSAVVMTHILPAALHLPELCQLSVKVGNTEEANSEVWLLLKEQIVAFHIEDPVNCLTHDNLPHILLKAPPIQQVELNFRSIGWDRGPVPLVCALAHVPRLLIKSRREMHLMMPETCSWRSVIIKADSSLHLTYQADTTYIPIQPAPTFVIRYGGVYAVGLWRLLRLLAMRRIEWGHDERVRATIVVRSWQGELDYPWTCACGACCTCLKRTGRLTHLWG